MICLWGKTGRNEKKINPFSRALLLAERIESGIETPSALFDIEDVEIPPYYADTDFCKRDWANGLEQMQLVDREIGKLLKRLDDEGLSENTVVFFIGDHGTCHIRGKQFLYDEGIRIPMVMKWPGKVKAGQVNHSLVSSIDICATVLDIAGAKPAKPIHGKNLLSDEVKNRKYIFAARDKMDETHDSMRCIRSKDFKLILNLMPERPYLQYNRYKEASYPMLAEMTVLHMTGKLTDAQAKFFAKSKPELELFDLNKDPHELNNLASKKEYASIKKELLAELTEWRKNVIRDTGVSETFRAADVYPSENPEKSVQAWADKFGKDYDLKKHGWPAWYPTRELTEWKQIRSNWEKNISQIPKQTRVKLKRRRTQRRNSYSLDCGFTTGVSHPSYTPP